jgi:acetyl esterase/lipase
VSPLYANLARLPPTLVLTGGNEILRDDTTRLAQHAREQGAALTAEVWPCLQHCWPLMLPAHPQTKPAMQRIANFLKAGE